MNYEEIFKTAYKNALEEWNNVKSYYQDGAGDCIEFDEYDCFEYGVIRGIEMLADDLNIKLK